MWNQNCLLYFKSICLMKISIKSEPHPPPSSGPLIHSIELGLCVGQAQNVNFQNAVRGERGGGEGSCRWNYNEKAYFFHGLTKLNFKIKVIFVFFTFVFQFWPKISHWIWYFIWLKLVLFDHFDIQKLYVKYPQYPTNMCVCWISISFEIHSLRSYN